jgi:ribosomal protein S18 acetylase RimI-like enzyme
MRRRSLADETKRDREAHVTGSEVHFRRATNADLSAIVSLLAADPLGASREQPGTALDPAYRHAFDSIEADRNQELVVAVLANEVAGVLQITFIPSLTHTGSWRAQIEGVRVAKHARSAGIGRRMIEYAIERAAARSCRIVQLTTDKRRPRAIEFYERLGFVASHEGMKLHLEAT